MANKPQFGGTNGVSELDVGQEGSTRRSSSKAWATLKVVMGPPQTRDVKHALPQQTATYVERMGWAGQAVTWTGFVKLKDKDELAALISHLSQYRTGQTINATTGARSAVDVGKMAPTKLADILGVVLSDNAVMTNVRFGELRKLTSGSSPYTIGMDMTIAFGILK